MKVGIHRSLVLCLFALLGNSLWAQTEEGTLLSFHFSIYTWQYQRHITMDSVLEEVPKLYYYDQNNYVDVGLRLGRNSAVHAYVGDNPFTLYKKIDRTDGPEFFPVSEVQISEDWDSVFLILFRNGFSGDGTGDGAMTLLPMDRMAILKEGHAMFLNMSSQSVAIRFGDTQILLYPHGSRQIPLNDNHSRMPLQLAVEEDETWTIELSTSMSLAPQNRMLVFFEPSRQSDEWLVKRVSLD